MESTGVTTATFINNPENFTGKTFDCQGYTITGGATTFYGFKLGASNKVSKNSIIKNCQFLSYDDEANSQAAAIYMHLNASNITIQNVNATGCNYGLWFNYSSGNTILNFNTTGNSDGGNLIYLDNSQNNTFTNIIALSQVGSGSGIILTTSSNNNFTNVTSNLHSTFGVQLTSTSNNNLFNNVTAINNSYYGFYITSNSINNVINNLSAIDNTLIDFYVDDIGS